MLTIPIISHLFIHTLTIKRNERTSDGQGGWVETPTASATVSGRVNPATANDLEVAGRMQAEVTHAIYFPASTDIKNGDWIAFGSRNFEVKVPNITPSKEIYKKVLCLEVQTAA